MKTVAVVLASGSGLRYGADRVPKHLTPIHGVPILIWTLNAALQSEVFSSIAVVVGKNDLQRTKKIVKEYFSDEQILPAVGQGVIALQCRIDDKKTLDILKMINDKESYYCIQAERALLEAIGGDCDTAVGALAKLSEDKIILKSELFSNDGKKKFVAESSGHYKKAKEIGYQAGEELLKKAGSDFKIQGN